MFCIILHLLVWIPNCGGAKFQCTYFCFKYFHYLCIKVGTRLCETLQNGAEFRWSNSGRLRLEHFFNAKIQSHLGMKLVFWWHHEEENSTRVLFFLFCSAYPRRTMQSNDTCRQFALAVMVCVQAPNHHCNIKSLRLCSTSTVIAHSSRVFIALLT